LSTFLAVPSSLHVPGTSSWNETKKEKLLVLAVLKSFIKGFEFNQADRLKFSRILKLPLRITRCNSYKNLSNGRKETIASVPKFRMESRREATEMRCHYKVLEVARDADPEAIRKAFHRMALKHHPDKRRPEDREAAEVLIKEINAAYETLSDPQERAWYDDHRESILRGGDGTASHADGSVSLTPDLWKFFSVSCFEGFGDDEKSFFRIYSGVFNSIVEIEKESGIGKVGDFPSLGTSKSSREEVLVFYAFWEAFSSKLSFGWMDQFNPNEGENRWQKRTIEKENLKLRSSAKKDYDQLVQRLVQFVKKRDIRVLAIIRERQEVKERKEEERRREVERKKAERRAAREGWEDQLKEREQEIQAEEEARGSKIYRLADEDLDEEDENKEQLVWQCVACSKNFKSQKQLANHENSKKHKESVKKMEKKIMEQEEEALRLAQLEVDAAAETSFKDSERQQEDNSVVEDEKDRAGEFEDESERSDSSGSLGDLNFGAFGQAVKEADDDETNSDIDLDGVQFSEQEENKDDDVMQAVEDRQGNVMNSKVDSNDAQFSEQEEIEDVEAEQQEKGQSEKVRNQDQIQGKTAFFCAVCSSFFASRNQLFKHIQVSGHAADPDTVKRVVKSAVKSRRKGERRRKEQAKAKTAKITS